MMAVPQAIADRYPVLDDAGWTGKLLGRSNKRTHSADGTTSNVWETASTTDSSSVILDVNFRYYFQDLDLRRTE